MEELKGKKNTKSAAASKARGLVQSFLKLETKKKIQYVAVLLLIIVILTIYFSSFKTGENNQQAPESNGTSVQSDDIETRLASILSSIRGAGKVKVMITYESSPEIVPAISVDKQSSSTTDESDNGSSITKSENTQSDIVMVNGNDGTAPVVLRENSPEIKGVIVVAQGADNIEVRLNLLEAVQTVLNVSPDKVDVYKMNIE